MYLLVVVRVENDRGGTFRKLERARDALGCTHTMKDRHDTLWCTMHAPHHSCAHRYRYYGDCGSPELVEERGREDGRGAHHYDPKQKC